MTLPARSQRRATPRRGVYASNVAKHPHADLIRALDDAIRILTTAGEEHWRSWLERDRRLVAEGDAYGVEHLMNAFGGMGSFNDLMLTAANGHSGTDQELCEMDDRLHELRDQIWTACRSLQRDLQ